MPYCFPQWRYHLTSPPEYIKVPISPLLHQHLLFSVVCVCDNSHLNGCEDSLILKLYYTKRFLKYSVSYFLLLQLSISKWLRFFFFFFLYTAAIFSYNFIPSIFTSCWTLLRYWLLAYSKVLFRWCSGTWYSVGLLVTLVKIQLEDRYFSIILVDGNCE